MNSRALFVLGAVAVVLAVSPFVIRHLIEKPPIALIEALTKTKPPPPLPAGDAAPLTVPDGFQATIFSRDVPGARVMTRDPKGVLIVSSTSGGKIFALPDTNGDGKADQTVTILSNLDKPHGITFICTAERCTLYVAETGSLKAFDYDAATMSATNAQEITTFPKGSGHFTRTIMPSPDNTSLFASMGSSCNVCNESDARRASIQRIDLLTREMKPYATGLRNSVFMALHPVTGELWASENGRDVIGDNIPPDEINIIKEGGNYGWPICYGNNVHDTDFDNRMSARDACANMQPAHIDLPAHSAALGIAFVPEDPPAGGWPEDMWHDLLIAYHGSWNRSEPTGYKVVRINLDPQGAVNGETEDFLSGFLTPGQSESDAIGRPVGILAEPGGIAYVSDDRAGAVYRISRISE